MKEVWQKAAVLKDFYQIQPGDNTPLSKPTEVLIGFDPKFLYIAFKATDEPDKVRATVAKRVSPGALALGQKAPFYPGRGSLLQFNGSLTYQPTNELRVQFSINSQRLRRYDTGRVAYKINILTLRGTYQFTKATFARLILDYNTLNSRLRSQALFGWTPSPGQRSMRVTTTI